MIIDELSRLDPSPVVLDIGCGKGMGVGASRQEFLWRIKDHCGELWGIDSDPSVQQTDGLFDRVETGLLEESGIPSESINLAFSRCVMEHVANPKAFLETIKRILRPGGIYIFLTPNGNSYFGRVAALSNRLRLDEMLLKRLKKQVHLDGYHYPLQCRCNRPSQLYALADEIGLHCECGFFERQGVVGYFPHALKPVLWMLNAKRRLIKNPNCLINLVCRMRKPPSC
jgi:SAM-dependent methyltransferase